MKKIGKIVTGILAIVLVFLCNNTIVYGASANMSGPQTVRSGDTISITLNVSDPGKYGVQGVLGYDANQLNLMSITTGLAGWKVETNAGNVIVYDDAMSTALGESNVVATFTFRVKATVATDEEISIVYSGVTTTDGNNENALGTVTYNVKVAAPLSGNANLSALTVGGHNLTPAFNTDTTTYNIGEVDYSVSNLTVNATKSDAGATVTVTGTALKVGNNTVTVTVKAANGTTKVYRINVTRKQDPNYKAANNANLSKLDVNSGILSPKFSADVTEYVVYLPYENIGKGFKLTGAAQDAKAQGVSGGSLEALAEGNNKVSLVCKAEDGTEKTYNVTVVIMPKYEGKVPNVEGVEPETEPQEPTVSDDEKPTQNDVENEDSEPITITKTEKTPAWLIILLMILGIGVGFGGCYILLSNGVMQ